jgi:hypothetical protein
MESLDSLCLKTLRHAIKNATRRLTKPDASLDAETMSDGAVTYPSTRSCFSKQERDWISLDTVHWVISPTG